MEGERERTKSVLVWLMTAGWAAPGIDFLSPGYFQLLRCVCGSAAAVITPPAPVCGDQAPLIGSAGVSRAGDKAPCARGGVLPVRDRVLPGLGIEGAPCDPRSGGWFGSLGLVLVALHRPCPGMRVWRGCGSEDTALFGAHVSLCCCMSIHPSVHRRACVREPRCDLLTRTPQGERGHYSWRLQPFLTAPWN